MERWARMLLALRRPFVEKARMAWALVVEPYRRDGACPHARLWTEDPFNGPLFRFLDPPRRGTATPDLWG